MMCRQRFKQVALNELNSVGNTVAFGINSRYVEGCGGQVGGDQSRRLHVHGDGYRDATGAGANVDDQRRLLRPFDQLDYALDYELGLGPGNEHSSIDDEIQTVEFLMAGNILKRLTTRAPFDEPQIGFVV